MAEASSPSMGWSSTLDGFRGNPSSLSSTASANLVRRLQMHSHGDDERGGGAPRPCGPEGAWGRIGRPTNGGAWPMEYRDPDAIVSTQWLEAQLDDAELRIFDCTVYLRPAPPDSGVPYHPESGRADYARGHIPHAAFLDLRDELSDPQAEQFFMFPSRERFVEAMERNGIGAGLRVVLYSAGSIMWATRVWWMLRAFGFEAAVLDGGFDKWTGEGRPVSTEAVTSSACALRGPPATGALRRQAWSSRRARGRGHPAHQRPRGGVLPWRDSEPLRAAGAHSGKRERSRGESAGPRDPRFPVSRGGERALRCGGREANPNR